MHKKLPFLFLFLVPALGFSQIVLDSADAIQLGDTFTRHRDTIHTLSWGTGGASQVWDFHTADRDDTTISWVGSPDTTSFSGDYTSSNRAITSDGEAYIFFDVNAGGAYVDGAAGDLLDLGFIINAPFSPDLTSRVYPATYGDGGWDYYEFDITLPGAAFSSLFPVPISEVRLKHVADVYDTLDGYGQVITPSDTFDCLRGVVTEYAIDSIWYKPVFPPTWLLLDGFPDTNITYSWIGAESGLALAEMGVDSLGNPGAFTYTRVPSPSSAAFTHAHSGVGRTIDFTDHSLGDPHTWSWDFGDGGSSSMPDPSHAYATDDTFNVCLTVTNDMDSDTYCEDVIVEEVVGIEEDLVAGAGWKVYPNPSNGLFNIQPMVESANGVYELTVQDMNGRIIDQMTIETYAGQASQVDLSEMPGGIYMLSLFQDGKRIGTGRIQKN